ncbi:MAG: lyase family protein [Patescibacteria group bacterium]
MEKNLNLPGNPRYQPEQLKPILGYDNLYRSWGEIEIAKLEVMKEIGKIPAAVWEQLTEEHRLAILGITTSETDGVERKITKHDVNAHNRLMKEVLPPELAIYIHMPLTSYDKISNGYVMMFRDAFQQVIKPAAKELIGHLADLTETFATTTQIGRTHGQQALPITVGFWFATLLYRITYNYSELRNNCEKLKGKISGATGAYNAQVALGFDDDKTGKSFEEMVLHKLNLKPAPISTQILCPEAVAYFLFSATMLSAALAQFGRDGRQLMRTEIGEIIESFGAGQVGSSTMAHKRNPINFENTEGMWLKNKNEFGKVMDTLISEHQRDLVNSSVMRDYPIILVNLAYQLNTLLRKDQSGEPFVKRIKVDTECLQNNLSLNANLIMAEPIYISLQLAGYSQDAHELVNRILTPMAKTSGLTIIYHLEEMAKNNQDISGALEKIPDELKNLFRNPELYTGKAATKAFEIAAWARKKIA